MTFNVDPTLDPEQPNDNDPSAPMQDSHGWNLASGFHLFEKFIYSHREPSLAWMRRTRHGSAARLSLAEMQETAGCLVYRIALPGIAHEHISLYGENASLVLSIGPANETPKKSRGNPVIQKVFALPPSGDTTSATARLKNGILTITIPKAGPKAGQANYPAFHRISID